MAAQVIPFAFQEHAVRTILIESDPWFCLVDICAVLEIKNSRDMTAKQLDIKGVEKVYTLTQGGEQEVTFINEPNLYRVVFRSNKPEAKAFQNWVFNDVLPTLRRQGRYQAPNARVEPIITLSMSQNECMAFIERCVAVAVRVATKASPRARRVRFSDFEKAEMLRLQNEGIGAAEIARRLNRSAGSVGNFLLHYRRNAARNKMN